MDKNEIAIAQFNIIKAEQMSRDLTATLENNRLSPEIELLLKGAHNVILNLQNSLANFCDEATKSTI